MVALHLGNVSTFPFILLAHWFTNPVQREEKCILHFLEARDKRTETNLAAAKVISGLIMQKCI